MSKSAFDFDSGSTTFDWTAYLEVRPQYPQSLYDLIFEYHREHSSKWHHAYDMGTGVGIVAGQLATQFERVTASDPSASPLSLAPSLMKSHFKKENVRFLQCKAEDVSKFDAGSVDMITMGEAIMYTDYPQTLASAAYLLPSGGTFAAWCYDIIPRVVSQPAFEPDELQTKIYELFDTFECSVIDARGSEPVSKLYSHMIDLKFSESEWTHVHRINWKRNRQFGPRMTKLIDEWPVVSCLRPWETVEEHEESCMIMQDVDMSFLKGYLDSLYPGATMGDFCPKELAALEKVMENGRRIDLEFTTSLVLATKK